LFCSIVSYFQPLMRTRALFLSEIAGFSQNNFCLPIFSASTWAFPKPWRRKPLPDMATKLGRIQNDHRNKASPANG
ncbi:MAG: hypothetical protein ACHQ1H_07945, partial [Nitrososphaerales archaeon]